MGQDNHTTTARKSKHLTEKDRYRIEGYRRAGMNPKEMAASLGVSVRTIQREVKRGTVEQMNSDLSMRKEYLADYAQHRHSEAAGRKGAKRKLASLPGIVAEIERRVITLGHSPDAAVGRMRLNGIATPCTKTVYSAIDAGLFPNLTNRDLHEKGRRKRRAYRKTRVALHNARGAGIDERPEGANDRSEPGHWEMDLIVSGTGKGRAALLVLTERMTREAVVAKLRDKGQKSVREAIDGIERGMGRRAFRERFKTITADNGSEFLDFERLEKSVCRGRPGKRTKVYYAHPYSAYERGSNENMNRIIRRFVPKGSDIRRVPLAEIARIQEWLNGLPRRILGYKTPKELAAKGAA